MTKLLQLPLRLSPSENFSFERFFDGKNAQLTSELKKMVHQDSLIYLWGEAHSGKSHLLQATCLYAIDQERTAIYIPLAKHQQMTPDVLEGLGQMDIVCLDDVAAIAGQSAWEMAIFNVFNQLRRHQKSLLMSAGKSSIQLPLQLADLKSRLSWGTQYQLQILTDKEKTDAILQEATRRSMALKSEAVDYLLKHHSRDVSDLIDFIGQLDKASLSAKRKPTIPFIKQLLNSDANG